MGEGKKGPTTRFQLFVTISFISVQPNSAVQITISQRDRATGNTTRLDNPNVHHARVFEFCLVTIPPNRSNTEFVGSLVSVLSIFLNKPLSLAFRISPTAEIIPVLTAQAVIMQKYSSNVERRTTFDVKRALGFPRSQTLKIWSPGFGELCRADCELQLPPQTAMKSERKTGKTTLDSCLHRDQVTESAATFELPESRGKSSRFHRLRHRSLLLRALDA